MKKIILFCIAGTAAGCITGLFGSGGGMILVPFLTYLFKEDNNINIFAYSVAVMLPICLASLTFSDQSFSLQEVSPYLFGSVIGGISSGILAKKIPAQWLHRILGVLILIGGIRICRS